jgi:hypothetical protein
MTDAAEAEVIRRLTVLVDGPALPREDRAAVKFVLTRFLEERSARARAKFEDEDTRPIARTPASKLADRGHR